MDWAGVFLLGLAVSMDGLGAGLAYGMKRIRIPLPSLVVVSLSSGIALGASMLAGHSVSWLVDGWAANAAGACMLFVMGVVMIRAAARQRSARDKAASFKTAEDHGACTEREGKPRESAKGENCGLGVGGPDGILPWGAMCIGCPYLPEIVPAKTLRVKIGSLRLVVHVLREPEAADLDGSGVLSLAEAALLGTALALDAAGAGFATAVSGLWSLSVPIVAACMKFAAVSLGVKLGSSCSKALGETPLAFAPGACLILLALLSLL